MESRLENIVRGVPTIFFLDKLVKKGMGISLVAGKIRKKFFLHTLMGGIVGGCVYVLYRVIVAGISVVDS